MVRELTIQPVLNGFVVHVGCQKVVFSSAKELSCGVLEYYSNPEKVEQRYIKNAVNKFDPGTPQLAAPRDTICVGSAEVARPR